LKGEPVRILDWQQEIAAAWHVLKETSKFDAQMLWSYAPPRGAATQQELVHAEEFLGHPLDPRYCEFLGYANGWPGLMLDIDLFGTAELCGEAMHRASEIIDSIDDSVMTTSAIDRSDILPIGLSVAQHDLFAVLKPSSGNAGVVIWFAGYEIERFATFDDFFLATIDYNRRRYEQLRNGEISA
jgi:hypothetical protein